MKKIQTLSTTPAWFEYEGSLTTGFSFVIGDTRTRDSVSAELLQRLLAHFSRQPEPVQIGASHDKPPAGSIGAWLIDERGGRQLASYVAAVLVAEGHAELSGTRLIVADMAL